MVAPRFAFAGEDIIDDRRIHTRTTHHVGAFEIMRLHEREQIIGQFPLHNGLAVEIVGDVGAFQQSFE